MHRMHHCITLLYLLASNIIPTKDFDGILGIYDLMGTFLFLGHEVVSSL